MRIVAFILAAFCLAALAALPAQADQCASQRICVPAARSFAPVTHCAPVAAAIVAEVIDPVVYVTPVAFFQFIQAPPLIAAAVIAPPMPEHAAVQATTVQATAPDGWPIVPGHVAPASVAVTSQPAPAIAEIAALAQQHCAQCHSGSKARGDVVLFDGLGRYDPQVSPGAILAAVTRQQRAMPLGGTRLDTREIELLRRHARASKVAVARP